MDYAAKLRSKRLSWQDSLLTAAYTCPNAFR